MTFHRLPQGHHEFHQAHLVVAAIAACAVLVETLAEDRGAAFGLSPDPESKAHIAKIQGPERLRRISIKEPHGTQTKFEVVKVRGPISNTDSAALVRHVVSGQNAYWARQHSLRIEVVGDKKYAIVILTSCSERCFGGESYMYSFWDGKWHFEYVVDEWIG